MFNLKIAFIFIAFCTLIIAVGYGVGYQASRKVEQALINDIKFQKAVISPGTVETSFGFFKAKVVVKDSQVTFQQQKFEIPVLQAENKWHRMVTRIPDILLKSDHENVALKVQGISTNSSVFDGFGTYKISETEVKIGKVEIDSPDLFVIVEGTKIQLNNNPKEQNGKSGVKIAFISVSDKSNSPDPILSIVDLELENGYQIRDQLLFNTKFSISQIKTDIKGESVTGESRDIELYFELSSEKQLISELNQINVSGLDPEFLAASSAKYNIKVPKIDFNLASANAKSRQFSFDVGQISYHAAFNLKQPDQEEAKADGVINDLDIKTNDFQIKMEESTLKSTGISNPQKVKDFNLQMSAFAKNFDTAELTDAFNALVYNIKGDLNVAYKNMTLSAMQNSGLNSPGGKLDFRFEIKNGIMDLDINPALQLDQIDKNPLIAMFLPIKTLEKDLKINIRQIDVGTIVTEAHNALVNQQSDLPLNSFNLVKISQKTPAISCSLSLKTDQNIEIKAVAIYDLKPLPADFDLNRLINRQPQFGYPNQLISKILHSSKIKLGLKLLEYKNLLVLTEQSLLGIYLNNMREKYASFIKEKGNNLESELLIENGIATLNGADFGHMLKVFGL
jgi:hypothetical protein